MGFQSAVLASRVQSCSTPRYLEDSTKWYVSVQHPKNLEMIKSELSCVVSYAPFMPFKLGETG